MSNIFFTSDWHLYHNNILRYCPTSRPFTSVEEMNEGIINAHNRIVSDNDHVYNLGDFSFGTESQTKEVLSRLKGNIHLILGNHDKLFGGSLLTPFTEVTHYKELPSKLLGVHVILFHFEIVDWHRRDRGSVHLFGHAHGNSGPHRLLQRSMCMDVGIDSRLDYLPWAWEEIKEKLALNQR